MTERIDPPLPRIHWTVVFLLGLATFGLFTSIWAIVQARWIAKIDPSSKAPLWIGLHWALALMSGFAALTPKLLTLEVLSGIASGVVYLSAYFGMKNSMEVYMNGVGSRPISLSGRMVCFFTATYLQYEMNVLQRYDRALIPLADMIG